MVGRDGAFKDLTRTRETPPPARQRIVSHNGSFAIEEIPEGGLAIVVRLQAPWVRYDFPIEDEVLVAFGKAACAPRIQTPNKRIVL